jgi:hypothetical protein
MLFVTFFVCFCVFVLVYFYAHVCSIGRRIFHAARLVVLSGLCVEILWANRVRVAVWLAIYCQSVRLGDKPLETYDKNFYFPPEHL